MEIISKKKNLLMGREEAWIRVEHLGKSTPTRKELIADAAKLFKSQDDCVIVDKIFTESGIASSKAKILIYGKAADVPKAKSDKMKIRMKLMKKGEEAPAAAPRTEDAKAPESKPEEKADNSGEKKEESKPAEEKKEEEKSD